MFKLLQVNKLSSSRIPSLHLTKNFYAPHAKFSNSNSFRPPTTFSNTPRIAPQRSNFCSHSDSKSSIRSYHQFLISSESTQVVPKTRSWAAKFIQLAGAELPARVGTVEQDPSANVYLASVPNDYEEDKEAAGILGVNYLFRSSASAYLIKFDKKDPSIHQSLQ